MGYSSNILRAGASTNSYQYVPAENTNYSDIKVIIYNKHATNGIYYKVDAKITNDSDWVSEVGELLLAGDSYAEFFVDSMFQFYRIGYKSEITDNPSDNIDIDYCAR